YHYASAAGTRTCEWRPDLQGGSYDVYVWYPSGSSSAQDAPFTVYYSGGNTTVDVDQTTNTNQWFYIGTWTFSAGTSGRVELTNGATSGNYHRADAVKFEQEE
ncbi:MAG: hypothetical protein J7M14_07440, partial [Planctomycetes bacterium]|nr:hypothetical protein [Planctomycetota bacterium]